MQGGMEEEWVETDPRGPALRPDLSLANRIFIYYATNILNINVDRFFLNTAKYGIINDYKNQL